MYWYDAHKIGSICNGVIKCTYAELFDKDFRKFFSIQHKAARKIVADEDFLFGDYWGEGTITPTGFPRNAWRDVWSPSGGGYIIDATLLGGDYPIVCINGNAKVFYRGKIKYVEAHVLPEAIEMMRRSILGLDKTYDNLHEAGSKIYTSKDGVPLYRDNLSAADTRNGVWTFDSDRKYYEIVRINDNNDPNYPKEQVVNMFYADSIPEGLEERLNEKSKEGVYHYELRYGNKKPKKSFDRILNLKPTDTVYVKLAAFDWYPANMDNAIVTIDGQKINLQGEIRRMQQKIKTDKFMLYGSAASTIL